MRHTIPVFLLFAASLLAAERPTDIRAVDSIGITVADLDRSVDFYSRVLHFQKVSEYETFGDAWEHLTGIFGLRMRTARMRLGDEFIELTEVLAPQGRPIPEDSRSNDRWFQHIAIITSDMSRAYQWLRENHVRHASSGPQRLPDWNKNAGGIEAFYFKDPDGHALEVLAFPPDKGASKWHKASNNNAANDLFLGIDHTAIVISNTEASTKFYENVLGFHIAGESENYGPEQEHLNNVFGARLRITAMRVSETGPGIEFLEYLAPSSGRPYPADAQANDLIHWQTRLQATNPNAAARRLRQSGAGFVSTGVTALPGKEGGFEQALIIRDHDGHAIELAK